MIIRRGTKRTRSQSISFTQDCLDGLEEVLKAEQRKRLNSDEKEVKLSHIVETACWGLIDKMKETA